MAKVSNGTGPPFGSRGREVYRLSRSGLTRRQAGSPVVGLVAGSCGR